MNVALGLLAVVFLVLLNGFFVATEFALVKVRPTRIDELARKGSPLARQARRLVQHLDAYLSATQLGITVASLGLGWIGEPVFARILDPLVRRFGLSEATVATVGAAVAFVAITFLHIVFGELAPKSIAIQRAEATSLYVALPMRAFYLLFYPAIWTLNGLARAALRLIGLRPAGEHELSHSEEELRLIVASMRGASGSARERLAVVERTLRLPQRSARDLMVPRRDIAYLRLDDTPEERRERMRASPHSRYPVVAEDIDHILGILNDRDLYLAPSEPRTPAELRALLRDPLYVPESMLAQALLREFRHRRDPLAIVVDEYGGTAGLITVRDVAESILGELPDEPDAGGPAIRPLPDGTFAVDPQMPLHEFLRFFDLPPAEDDAATVAGLIMSRLGRVAAQGDHLSLGPVELTVEQVDGPRIVRLTARRRPSPTELNAR